MVLSPVKLAKILADLHTSHKNLENYLDENHQCLIGSVLEEFNKKYQAYWQAFNSKKKKHGEIDQLLNAVNKYYKEHVHALYKILTAYNNKLIDKPSNAYLPLNKQEFASVLNNDIRIYHHKIRIKVLNKVHHQIKQKALTLKQVYHHLGQSAFHFHTVDDSYYQLLEVGVRQKSIPLLYALKQESQCQKFFRANLRHHPVTGLAQHAKIIQENDKNIEAIEKNYKTLKREVEKLVTAEILLKIYQQIDKKIASLQVELYLPFLDKSLTKNKIEALEALKAKLYEASNTNQEIGMIIADWKSTTTQQAKQKNETAVNDNHGANRDMIGVSTAAKGPQQTAQAQGKEFTYANILATPRSFLLFSAKKLAETRVVASNPAKKTSSENLVEGIVEKYGQCTINIRKA